MSDREITDECSPIVVWQQKNCPEKSKKIRQDFSQQSEKGCFKDTDLIEHSSVLLELKKKKKPVKGTSLYLTGSWRRGNVTTERISARMCFWDAHHRIQAHSSAANNRRLGWQTQTSNLFL